MKYIVSPLLIIFLAVTLRLIPHPPNFAPIAAMALFGGAYLGKRDALIVPLLAMVLSDFFLGFHNTMTFVYGSFLISGLIGIWLKRHLNVINVILGVFTSSIIFFLITNFGVWLVGGLYEKTFQGLLQSYFYAIPFFRNTVIGDLFYTGLFFSSYEILLRVVKRPARFSRKYENLHTNRG